MIEADLDSILMILENPTRRDIIKRLSEESNYPLQLAKDLGLGQQLVAKHLRTMEDAGIVKSSIESSPTGPKRRLYVLNKSLSVTVDVAAHLFKAKVVSFDAVPKNEEISEASASLIDRVDKISGHPEEYERINPFTKVISDIDEKLEALENERSILLYIRNFAMREASHIVETFKNSDTRRILYRTLDSPENNIKNISESLNLREALVRQALVKLQRDFNIGGGTVEE